MSCPVCGHCWRVTAILEGEAANLVNDLCPECQSQGEPKEVVDDQSPGFRDGG